MPELPEVETLRRQLAASVVGRTITAVELAPGSPSPIAIPAPGAFVAAMAGRRIAGVGRRGKYLLLALDDGSTLALHLRMSGGLLHRPPGTAPEAYLRAALRLDDGSELRFTDVRKFGRLWHVPEVGLLVDGLGPEPLAEDFTVGALAAVLSGRRAPVKSVLLDQRALAGVGNVYADEALFAAGIDPRRPAHGLSPQERKRLHAALRAVLGAAIENGGTSLRDYRGLEGETGRHQHELRVYGRAEQPCSRCGTPVRRVVLAGRGTHFCPGCQK